MIIKNIMDFRRNHRFAVRTLIMTVKDAAQVFGGEQYFPSKFDAEHFLDLLESLRKLDKKAYRAARQVFEVEEHEARLLLYSLNLSE